jgi:hypothetical protein
MKSKKNKVNFKETPLFSLGISVLTTIILLVIVTIVGSVTGQPMQGPKYTMLRFFEQNIIINSLASIILILVMSNYFSIYFKTKAKFSLGLIAMSIALMVPTLTSNPIIQYFFGFREPSGLFSLISSIFTLFAAIVLLYLSRE